MKKLIELNTDDNHIIYWTLEYLKEKNYKIIIFVHWLFWNQNDIQYINATKYFYGEGFDTFIFDLYSDNKNARKLNECSISTNSIDLQNVINYFKLQYKDLYIIAHSLGGLAVINTDTSIISKIILWEPSAWLRKEEEKSDINYDKKSWLYVVDRWVKFTINNKMIKEWKDAVNINKYINKLNNNINFIFAWNSPIYKNRKPYISNYKQTVIKWASHTFSKENIEKQLFEQTLKYLIK